MSIKPNRAYTFEELRQMRERPELGAQVLRGMALRHNLDGTATFVPWHEAAGGGGTFGGKHGKLRSLHGDKEVVHTPTGTGPVFDELPRIVKRTPTQRVDAMMLRVLADFKAGNVMTEEQLKAHVSEVTAQAWKDGRTEITGEVVKEVIQRFMQRAENVNDEKESRKVVRTGPSD